MKTLLQGILITVIAVGFTGCGWKANTEKVLYEHQISNANQYVVVPDPIGEKILYEAFYTSPIEWIPADLEKVLEARAAISSAENYLKRKERREGANYFVTVREMFFYMFDQYDLYEQGLDSRAGQVGVLTREQLYIYNDVVGDVRTNLNVMRRSLDQEITNINEKVDTLTKKNLEDIYKYVKPLLKLKIPGI